MNARTAAPSAGGGCAPLVPDAPAVMARSSSENFPVASRLLPGHQREHLLALYGFARLADEIGDALRGDRLAALDWLEQDLDRAYRGEASHPILRRLSPTLHTCRLPRAPFLRLIEANRTDQRVRRYESWEALLGYCALSANPVGELVLGVFGLATPERIARSDDVCTALQLVEHWQDVGEDLALGRVYLPSRDMERFGCSAEDLAATRVGRSLRNLLAHEVDCTGALMDRGAPLVGMLRNRPRIAVAGFVGGGRAALAALAAADYEVLAARPRPHRRQIGARILYSLLAGR